MERLTDKLMTLALGVVASVWLGYSVATVIACLVAVSMAAASELRLPLWLRIALPVAYLTAAVFFPAFLAFAPLAGYDLMRLPWPWLALLVVIPVLLGSSTLPPETTITIVVAFGIAVLLSWRTSRAESALATVQARRDDLAEASRSLEARNRDLTERQDLELRLATLNERGRIAREIHDNVGHLLTRSVLQVEALQVVHAGDAALGGQLAAVGETLHTAFETVRASVHDLHDEALDLLAQLEEIAANTTHCQVLINYETGELPPGVTAAFLAIVREALSNTERHSDATEVKLSVVQFPGLYQLRIHDNGSKPPKRGGGGIGLTTMEDRVRALGGTFRTSYDHGFSVFVSVPRARQTEGET
ncbi:MAG: histidine kinase [Propionibacteriaceae bacterium]|nr:histidine kinase [Propionibacteriaceae bacterium]